PAFLADHHIRDFFCDSMRMAITGTEAFDLDQLLELDMDVHHHQASIPIASLSTMADSLPGLGIVAAVLGVVITMGALGEDRRKRLGTRSLPHWWEPFWAFCSATDWWARSPPIWRRSPTMNTPTSMSCES